MNDDHELIHSSAETDRQFPPANRNFPAFNADTILAKSAVRASHSRPRARASVCACVAGAGRLFAEAHHPFDCDERDSSIRWLREKRSWCLRRTPNAVRINCRAQTPTLRAGDERRAAAASECGVCSCEGNSNVCLPAIPG